MSLVSKIFGLIVGFFTIYSTPKVVQVQNKKIAAFNRTIQLLIFSYVLGYMIIAKKGYQLSSPIESAVITKIKGIIKVNLTDHPDLNEHFDKDKLPLYNRVFDGQDIVYPPKESNGFFLTSNLIITQNQTLGTCPDETSSVCDPDKAEDECLDRQSVLSEGFNDGKCVQGLKNQSAYFCEIEGWCPTEDDKNFPLKNKLPVFDGIEDFTVLIKNTIRFPLFNLLRRNIDDGKKAEDELRSCSYDPIKSPRCPIFKIGKILELANVNFNEIASLGGVIAIQINWDCDLDYDLSHCFPTYTFTRLDLKNTKVSPGYNFRYAHYNGVGSRDLFKAYGIRFEILTSGRGSKFSIVPLALNIGSGLGLLALATLICDFILLYFTSHKDVYNKKKYLYVKEEISKVATDSCEQGPF